MSLQVRFKTYDPLRKALHRSGIQKAASTATVLLQTFVEADGKLRATDVYAKGLCKNGEFKVWRKALIDKGWLQFEVSSEKSFSRYSPGHRLLQYVNREKAASKELATKDEMRALEYGIEKRLKSLEVALAGMIAEYDPPVTKKKLSDAIVGYEKVGRAALEALKPELEKPANEIPF